MSTEGYTGQKYQSLSDSEEVDDQHVVTLQIQQPSPHIENSNYKLKIRERGKLWVIFLLLQSVFAFPFVIFPPIAREYYFLFVYLPISIYLWLVIFSCLWVEVEDFGTYLSIKTGPLSVLCCCQKSEIQYSDILKWQLYDGDAGSTYGVGYTCTCDNGCIKTLNLKPRVAPVQIVLKPNSQTGCAKSITFSVPNDKIEAIFALLQEKCKEQIDNHQYKVTYPTGAKCRKDKNISSQEVGILPINTIVTVEEIDGRRCRITSPIEGWLSLYNTNGHRILLPQQKEITK